MPPRRAPDPRSAPWCRMAEASRRRLLRTGILLAALGIGALGVLLLYTTPRPDAREAVGQEAAAVPVIAHRVESRVVQPRTELAGVVEARRSVELFAETDGRVVELGAEELDRVEEGQLLARIDTRMARVAVDRARAAVARTRSELELARLSLARRRSLAERDATSAAALDEAENQERVAAASQREARAALEEALDRLGKKIIRAPFAGALRSFPLEEGEYVQSGQRIAELLDLERVRVQVGLSDREIVEVRPGAPASLRLEALPGESFTGSIVRVGSASDSETKKFPVQVELPNQEGRLLPGMVARIVLELGGAETLTVIPRDATRDEYGLRFVFVLERDGGADLWVARRRRIQVRELPFLPADLAVTSGLEPGEEIAVSGLRQLRHGAPVRLLRSDAS